MKIFGKEEICCCRGDMCNMQNLTVVAPNPSLNTSDYADVIDMNDGKNLSYLQRDVFTTIGFYVTITIIALVLLIVLMMILFMVWRFKLKKKKFCRRLNDSHLSDNLINNHQINGLNGIIPHGKIGFQSHEVADDLQLGLLKRFKKPQHGGGWMTNSEISNVSYIFHAKIGSRCEKIRLMSRGSFGRVWLGKLTSDESTIDVAIKVFQECSRKSWETEINFFRLPQIEHPNILKFFGVDDMEESSEYMNPRELWLVSAFHQHGSLYDYLSGHIIDVQGLLRLSLSLAQGLSHLHAEQGPSSKLLEEYGFDSSSSATTPTQATILALTKPSIAHRDFTARNILVKQDCTACIADFGLVLTFETGHCVGDAHFQVGTKKYMAPEVLDGAIQFSRDAFLRIDIYAMGLVIWELMTRCANPHQSEQRASSCEDESISAAPVYKSPFEQELGPQPTIGQLQHFVSLNKKRPLARSWWSHDQVLLSLWDTVQQCWDQDADARLSAGCVSERIRMLQRSLLTTSPDSSNNSEASLSSSPPPSQLLPQFA